MVRGEVASLGAQQRQQEVATEVLKEMVHKLQGELASLKANQRHP